MYLVDKYCWWEGKRRQRRNVIYWSLVNLWQVWERYEAQIRAWCTVLIGNSTGLMSAWLEGSCYMLYIKRTVAAAAAATNLPCCWFLYLQPNIIYTPLVHVVGDTEASGELYLFFPSSFTQRKAVNSNAVLVYMFSKVSVGLSLYCTNTSIYLL